MTQNEKSKIRAKVIKWVTRLFLILVAIIMLYPLAWNVVSSFKTSTEFLTDPFAWPQGLAWDNYVRAYEKSNLAANIGNSIYVVLETLVIIVICVVPCSYCLVRYKFPGAKLILNIYMAAIFIQATYIMIPLFLQMNKLNLLNSLTGDKEFLRTRVEPYFTATAACLEELLQEGPDGKLVLPVSSSPEIHDDEAASWLTPNSNYDLALLHYLFQTLVQIEYQLGNPRGYWHAMEAKLAPLSVDTETGLMLSPNETLQETHRHFSHAMAIEPLCMLRYENPQDRSVIDATVDHLVHLGSGQWVGFSFGWMALLQIARSNGNGALYELHRFAEHFLSRNGFHLNGDYKNSGVCDFHYRPFTLEADFLAAHAVQKMLLRSEKNHIEVLPACPQGWKNEPVAFQNLRAENGLLISYQRTADGKHSLTVKATQDGSWYLCNTHCWVTLQAGQTQSYQWTEENKK